MIPLKHTFQDEGFIIIKDFFSPEILEDFEEALYDITRLVKNKGGMDGEAYDALFQTPQFLRIAGYKKTQEIINYLFGKWPSNPLYAFTNRCRIDRPFDERRTYGWHQEVFYTIPESKFIQTWAPLIHDTTIQNGTIEICIGSHKEGIAAQSWNEKEGGATQIIVDQNIVKKYKILSVPMKLGEMMFFDGRLFHRSGKNTSEETRYSLVGMYHDAEFPSFRPPKMLFEWRGKSPKEYFDSSFPEKQKAKSPHG